MPLSNYTFNLQIFERQNQSLFAENKTKIFQVSLIIEIAKQSTLSLLKL